MSIDATRWAWMQSSLKPTEKLVLLSLADRAGEMHECYPSIARLVSDTGLHRETIMTCVAVLERKGLIVVSRALGRGNRYLLVGVDCRNQSGKAYQSGKADYTSPEKPTTTSPEKPTLNLSVESISKPEDVPAKAYAFAGSTVRLTDSDFDKLQTLYPLINLSAELAQLDVELQGKRKWWGDMNAKLNYRNKVAGNGFAKNPTGASCRSSAAGRGREAAARARAQLAASGDH